MTDHAHRHNLMADLQNILPRRRFLLLAGAGLPALAACTAGSPTGGTVAAAGSDGCVIWPEETNGPYPADGTNSANGSLANVLIESGIVRQNMVPSFAGLSGQAAGVPMRLRLRLVDSTNACAGLSGYAVYVWHCDAAGRYSVYNLPEQNYLRAVGVADSDGVVTFDTIYPGCYRGRAPHIHFEVYPSLEKASAFANRVLCSQIAFPDAVSKKIYEGVSDYADSIVPLSNISIATDGIFADNTAAQIRAQTATMNGTVATDFQADLTVGIDPDAKPVSMPGGPDGFPSGMRGPPPDGFPPGPPPGK
ncbi:MAG: hypothetical protein KDA53_12785 [Hyphomonas sp.]|nr:hypothetical protein [Hyphomonas sp.]